MTLPHSNTHLIQEFIKKKQQQQRIKEKRNRNKLKLKYAFEDSAGHLGHGICVSRSETTGLCLQIFNLLPIITKLCFQDLYFQFF